MLLIIEEFIDERASSVHFNDLFACLVDYVPISKAIHLIT